MKTENIGNQMPPRTSKAPPGIKGTALHM